MLFVLDPNDAQTGQTANIQILIQSLVTSIIFSAGKDTIFLLFTDNKFNLLEFLLFKGYKNIFGKYTTLIVPFFCGGNQSFYRLNKNSATQDFARVADMYFIPKTIKIGIIFVFLQCCNIIKE